MPRYFSAGPATLAKKTAQVFSKLREVRVDSRKRASESGLRESAAGEASCLVPFSSMSVCTCP